VKTLKYLYDYVSSPEYETRYQKIHEKNFPFYQVIENNFKNSVPEGVRLYRPMHRFKDITLPDEFIGEKNILVKSTENHIISPKCHRKGRVVLLKPILFLSTL
jgi:hypothetical protein